MSVSDCGVIVQNISISSFVKEAKEKKDSDPNCSKSKVQSINTKLRFFPKEKMVCFTIRVDYAFLRWES